MPNPIRASIPATTGYYDEEAGECRLQSVAVSNGKKPAVRSDAASPSSEGYSATAVEKLVQEQARRQCLRDAVTAGGACLAAAAGAVTAQTVLGAVLAISAGAVCGAKLAQAEKSCGVE
jgi:hypothetical protein